MIESNPLALDLLSPEEYITINEMIKNTEKMPIDKYGHTESRTGLAISLLMRTKNLESPIIKSAESRIIKDIRIGEISKKMRLVSETSAILHPSSSRCTVFSINEILKSIKNIS